MYFVSMAFYKAAGKRQAPEFTFMFFVEVFFKSKLFLTLEKIVIFRKLKIFRFSYLDAEFATTERTMAAPQYRVWCFYKILLKKH